MKNRVLITWLSTISEKVLQIINTIQIFLKYIVMWKFN